MPNHGKSGKKGEIPFQFITPKQHVSDCIDLATELLREIVSLYCNQRKQQCPFNCQVLFLLIQSVDLTTLVNFILDNNRYDCIIERTLPINQNS